MSKKNFLERIAKRSGYVTSVPRKTRDISQGAQRVVHFSVRPTQENLNKAAEVAADVLFAAKFDFSCLVLNKEEKHQITDIPWCGATATIETDLDHDLRGQELCIYPPTGIDPGQVIEVVLTLWQAFNKAGVEVGYVPAPYGDTEVRVSGAPLVLPFSYRDIALLPTAASSSAANLSGQPAVEAMTIPAAALIAQGIEVSEDLPKIQAMQDSRIEAEQDFLHQAQESVKRDFLLTEQQIYQQHQAAFGGRAPSFLDDLDRLNTLLAYTKQAKLYNIQSLYTINNIIMEHNYKLESLGFSTLLELTGTAAPKRLQELPLDAAFTAETLTALEQDAERLKQVLTGMVKKLTRLLKEPEAMQQFFVEGDEGYLETLVSFIPVATTNLFSHRAHACVQGLEALNRDKAIADARNQARTITLSGTIDVAAACEAIRVNPAIVIVKFDEQAVIEPEGKAAINAALHARHLERAVGIVNSEEFKRLITNNLMLQAAAINKLSAGVLTEVQESLFASAIERIKTSCQIDQIQAGALAAEAIQLILEPLQQQAYTVVDAVHWVSMEDLKNTEHMPSITPEQAMVQSDRRAGFLEKIKHACGQRDEVTEALLDIAYAQWTKDHPYAIRINEVFQPIQQEFRSLLDQNTDMQQSLLGRMKTNQHTYRQNNPHAYCVIQSQADLDRVQDNFDRDYRSQHPEVVDILAVDFSDYPVDEQTRSSIMRSLSSRHKQYLETFFMSDSLFQGVVRDMFDPKLSAAKMPLSTLDSQRQDLQFRKALVLKRIGDTFGVDEAAAKKLFDAACVRWIDANTTEADRLAQDALNNIGKMVQRYAGQASAIDPLQSVVDPSSENMQNVLGSYPRGIATLMQFILNAPFHGLSPLATLAEIIRLAKQLSERDPGNDAKGQVHQMFYNQVADIPLSTDHVPHLPLEVITKADIIFLLNAYKNPVIAPDEALRKEDKDKWSTERLAKLQPLRKKADKTKVPDPFIAALEAFLNDADMKALPDQAFLQGNRLHRFLLLVKSFSERHHPSGVLDPRAQSVHRVVTDFLAAGLLFENPASPNYSQDQILMGRALGLGLPLVAKGESQNPAFGTQPTTKYEALVFRPALEWFQFRANALFGSVKVQREIADPAHTLWSYENRLDPNRKLGSELTAMREFIGFARSVVPRGDAMEQEAARAGLQELRRRAALHADPRGKSSEHQGFYGPVLAEVPEDYGPSPVFVRAISTAEIAQLIAAYNGEPVDIPKQDADRWIDVRELLPKCKKEKWFGTDPLIAALTDFLNEADIKLLKDQKNDRNSLQGNQLYRLLYILDRHAQKVVAQGSSSGAYNVYKAISLLLSKTTGRDLFEEDAKYRESYLCVAIQKVSSVLSTVADGKAPLAAESSSGRLASRSFSLGAKPPLPERRPVAHMDTSLVLAGALDFAKEQEGEPKKAPPGDASLDEAGDVLATLPLSTEAPSAPPTPGKKGSS